MHAVAGCYEFFFVKCWWLEVGDRGWGGGMGNGGWGAPGMSHMLLVLLKTKFWKFLYTSTSQGKEHQKRAREASDEASSHLFSVK